MNDRVFIDTNIFVSSIDDRDALKQSIAGDLLRSIAVSGEGTVSYQVIQEFFNVMLGKLQQKMTHADAQRYLDTTFRPLHTVGSSAALVSDAIGIQEQYRLSWYDSLIVAAAQHGGCKTLYSEDLQHGRKFGTVTVRDPFR